MLICAIILSRTSMGQFGNPEDIGWGAVYMPPETQPLQTDMVVIGRTMPVLSMDVFAE